MAQYGAMDRDDLFGLWHDAGPHPHNLSYSSIVANLVGTTISHWSCISNSILVNQENAFEYFVCESWDMVLLFHR